MSELEKWLEHAYDEEGKKYAENGIGACACFKEGAKQTARKLIEVMEERGYDHPHRAAGIDYNQGYIDGRQETINYIKRWCEEE